MFDLFICVPLDQQLKMVMLGKTGVGKSTLGNIILNKEKFLSEISANSVTKECDFETTVVGETCVCVVDTPGVFDTVLSKTQVNKVVGTCMNLCLLGTHAFLLVFRLSDRFTMETKKTAIWMQDNFGKGALDYTIILFTYVKEEDVKDVGKFINSCKPLKTLIDKCHGRYHTCNILNRVDSQISELVEKVKGMCHTNGDRLYCHEMYKNAQTSMKKSKKIESGLKIAGAVGTAAAITGAAVTGGAQMAAIPIAAGATVVIGETVRVGSKKIRKKWEADKMKMFEDKNTE